MYYYIIIIYITVFTYIPKLASDYKPKGEEDLGVAEKMFLRPGQVDSKGKVEEEDVYKYIVHAD